MRTHETAKKSFIPSVTKSEVVGEHTRAFQMVSPKTAETTEFDIQAKLDHANRFGHDLTQSQPLIQRQVEPDAERREEEEAIIQTKLTIGQPGDKYEQEADAMAAKVMAMPDPSGGVGEWGSRAEGQAVRSAPNDEPQLKTNDSPQPQSLGEAGSWIQRSPVSDWRFEFGVGLVPAPKFDSPFSDYPRNYSNGKIPELALGKGFGMRYSQNGIEPIVIDGFGQSEYGENGFAWNSYSPSQIKKLLGKFGNTGKGKQSNQSLLNFPLQSGFQLPLPQTLLPEANNFSSLRPDDESNYQLEHNNQVPGLFSPPSLLSPGELELRPPFPFPDINSDEKKIQKKHKGNQQAEGISQVPSLIQGKGASPQIPNDFESQLAQHKGGGRPLSNETRAFMELRFGADFSNVRVHETPDLADAIQAQAFTHGQDIYFNAGKNNPKSSEGKELLAHELTHVVQQTQLSTRKNQTENGETTDFQRQLIQRQSESVVDNPEESMTRLSGYYEYESEIQNGQTKITGLFLNVNRLTLVGNYRSFIRGENRGFDVLDSGDVQGERIRETEQIRYSVTSNNKAWNFSFGEIRSGIAGDRRIPLIAKTPDGEEMRFRRRGSSRPITAQDTMVTSDDDANALDVERRSGLTPPMRTELAASARSLVREQLHRPVPGLRGQRELERRAVANAFNEALVGFSGRLRERAQAYLLNRLNRYRVNFLGENLHADEAVREALGEDLETEALREIFRYEIIFRGIRGGGRLGAGLHAASGSVQVRAFQASWTESRPEVAWEKFYYFNEIRVQASGGGGLTGGVYWQTFQASSSVEWTQEDFSNADIGIFGVSGPSAQASAGVGPISSDLISCNTYKFEGVSLTLGNKILELQADEKIFECSPSVLNSDSGGINAGRSNNNRQNNGQIGIDTDFGVGQLEGGIGHIEGLPGENYSDERQQVVGGNGERLVEINPPRERAGFDVASSDVDNQMILDLTHRLSSFQQELREHAIPVRIIGHASSLWTGRTDPIAGNLALSRKRAQSVSKLIRQVFELPRDRLLDVSGQGDQEHRAAGGTVKDDAPMYRRVDVLIEGKRPIFIYF